MSTATKRRCKQPSANGKSKLDRYAVKFVPVDSITPSPENDEIYGPIEHDDSMDNLIGSMRRKGMEEPILLTTDRFILSGHRRHYAAKWLG
jgi:ParB-like chromosome segregation protein Spo0J